MKKLIALTLAIALTLVYASNVKKKEAKDPPSQKVGTVKVTLTAHAHSADACARPFNEGLPPDDAAISKPMNVNVTSAAFTPNDNHDKGAMPAYAATVPNEVTQLRVWMSEKSVAISPMIANDQTEARCRDVITLSTFASNSNGGERKNVPAHEVTATVTMASCCRPRGEGSFLT
jgi:hypothetical protein